MNSSKSKLWFVLTIFIGIAAALMVANYLKTVKTATENRAVTTVIVAVYKVPRWTRITKDMIKTVQVPAKGLPAQAFTSPAQVIGQVSTVELMPEEMLTAAKLGSEQSGELAYKIPDGFRALTIAINTISGVAGNIKPGNRVDILMSYNLSGNLADTKVLTLTQNSLVLAVGGGAQPKEGEAPAQDNLTLAVTPQEAQYVMFSENIGKMKLALRPATDQKKPQLKTIDVKSFQTAYP